MKQYDTTMIWSGQTCYDLVAKKGKRFFAAGDKCMHVEDVEFPNQLSRVEHTEQVKYVLYSVSPLIWSENDDLFVEYKLTPPPKKRCV